MSSEDDRPQDAAGLRRRAEEMARAKGVSSPEKDDALSPEETRRTLYELRVHQIELEMQNEELRRAQVDLDAARERYFDLYDLAPAGYCTVSEHGLILEANLTAAGLLGETRDALFQRRLSRFILPGDQAIYYQHFKQLLETGDPQAWELRLLRKDSAPFWARLEAIAAQDPEGTPVSRVVMIDIDTVKRSLEETREARDFAEALVETVREPLLTLDSGLRILKASPSFYQAFRTVPGETEGRSLFDLGGGHWKIPALRDLLEQVLPHLAQFENFEVAGEFPSIGHRVMLLNGRRFARPAGGKPMILLAMEDITEYKRALEALAQQAAELARSNGELQQFAYVASHDLQEPLRAVASFTKLLGERYQGRLDSDADEFIGFVVDGTRRMQALINDLLAYSRVGTRSTPFAPTNCEDVLEEVLANLAPAIEEASGQVTHDPLPILDADETQLGQVFQNLIGNALKFHGAEAPRVHVSAQRASGEWRFSVRDNGIGIDPQNVDEIFVMFQRLHTSAEYPGTGIGLAITKKIVERHGGQIWVESEPGKGATFYFTIAAAEPIKRLAKEAAGAKFPP